MDLEPCRTKNHTHGFDVEFREKLPEKYVCAICRKALRTPLQTPCGHRYCEPCLAPLFTRQKEPRCPLDNETLVPTEIFRDVCCKREILRLICYCTFKKYGCGWSGELQLLEEHTADCPYEEVPCPNIGCTVKLAKLTLEEHSKNECIYKREPCPYCEELIAKTEQESHYQSCPKFPVDCPSECGASGIPRDSLEEHRTNQCALTEITCSFSTVGCTFKGLREEVKEHAEQYKDKHLQMVFKKLNENSLEAVDVNRTIEKLNEEKAALQMQVSTQNETLATTVQNLRAMQMRLGNVEKAVSEQRQELAEVRRNFEAAGDSDLSREHLAAQLEEYGVVIGQHEAKMATLERDLARAAVPGPSAGPRSLGFGGSERRLDRNEHQLTLHDIQLAEQDLKIKLLEATSYDGSYIWKIDEWRRRLQEAKSGKTPSIYSPPFYVGRFGYKLCARVYPNGDGMGKGSHFSLFFVVMRGEYDALLPWPFSQKVNFRLLDQNGDQHVEDSFRPDPVSSSFRRPNSNMNIASGCPLFVSHSTLRTRGYVKDDIVFVRIDIDKSGLPPVCL